MHIECDRYGKVQIVNETHMKRGATPIRTILDQIRHAPMPKRKKPKPRAPSPGQRLAHRTGAPGPRLTPARDSSPSARSAISLLATRSEASTTSAHIPARQSRTLRHILLREIAHFPMRRFHTAMRLP
jgi:hypothetical protein